MRAVLARHSGEVAKQLFDVPEKNMAEGERLVRATAGFVLDSASYAQIRAGSR